MTNKEIRDTLRCLQMMCDDLNDMHNNYDVDTQTELNYQTDIRNAIKDFNSSQKVWCAKLVPCKKGWCITYV